MKKQNLIKKYNNKCIAFVRLEPYPEIIKIKIQNLFKTNHEPLLSLIEKTCIDNGFTILVSKDETLTQDIARFIYQNVLEKLESEGISIPSNIFKELDGITARILLIEGADCEVFFQNYKRDIRAAIYNNSDMYRDLFYFLIHVVDIDDFPKNVAFFFQPYCF